MYVYIERRDGKIARLEIPDDLGVWDSIWESWPKAYDYIDEDMLIPGYIAVTAWDDRFDLDDGPTRDASLISWIIEGLAIPRKDWAKMLSEGILESWDEGRDMSHAVQPGTLNGHRFEIEYEFGDDEEDPEEDNADDDQYWLSHVVDMRWVIE